MSYLNNTEHNGHEKRSALREIADKYYSVEFKAEGSDLSYRFRLRDISSTGMCVLVKETSELLNYIKAGDILSVKYYFKESLEKKELIITRIKHITKNDQGRYKGHYLVGLEISEYI